VRRISIEVYRRRAEPPHVALCRTGLWCPSRLIRDFVLRPRATVRATHSVVTATGGELVWVGQWMGFSNRCCWHEGILSWLCGSEAVKSVVLCDSDSARGLHAHTAQTGEKWRDRKIAGSESCRARCGILVRSVRGAALARVGAWLRLCTCSSGFLARLGLLKLESRA
jgi:hypothetical protein